MSSLLLNDNTLLGRYFSYVMKNSYFKSTYTYKSLEKHKMMKVVLGTLSSTIVLDCWYDDRVTSFDFLAHPV